MPEVNRPSRLLCNMKVAAMLVPGFVIGQAAFIPVGIDNWVLCFGLCVGGFTFAIVDAIVGKHPDARRDQ